MIRVVFVGTSDAFGSGGRRQSAYLLRGGSGSVLLDCGGTTTTGLEQLGIARDEIEAIVLSHFHADHFGGIPLFLLAAHYVDGRRHPLRIAGPAGVEDRVRRAAAALGHPLDTDGLGFGLEFHDLEADVPWSLGDFTFRSFSTYHSPDALPHGLVCDVAGRRIAYSGDTGWFDELPERVKGANLFICECTQDRRDYEYHLSLEELVSHRGRLSCDRVVLTHLGPEMRSRGAPEGFELADDGLVIEL